MRDLATPAVTFPADGDRMVMRTVRATSGRSGKTTFRLVLYTGGTKRGDASGGGTLAIGTGNVTLDSAGRSVAKR